MNKRKVTLLLDKDLRAKYLSDQLRIGLRYQLRSIRDSQEVTQKQLADMIGTKQSVISRLEAHPERVSLPTLLDIANALDVGLVVRFEEIDTIIEWNGSPTVKKMTPRQSSQILPQIIAELNETNPVSGYKTYADCEPEGNIRKSQTRVPDLPKEYEQMPYSQSAISASSSTPITD